jgi:hypothetical protein
LKLKYDELLSNVAFDFDVRRYIAGEVNCAKQRVARLQSLTSIRGSQTIRGRGLHSSTF